MKTQLIVLISIFSLTFGFAQPSLPPPPPEKIKILSWNIYMLPSIIKATGKTQRAELIGKTLKYSDYDVIVFQEAFQRKARKKIFDQLKDEFPYQAGPANQKLISYRTNSGLWIFSKHPIVATQSIVFKNRSGVDAFSRKGGLIAEISVHGTLVQIAATHLQNSGQPWVRQSQCVEFYERLLKPFQREGVPQIICGDFNIHRQSEEYNFMLQTLHAEDGELGGDIRCSYDRLYNDITSEPGTQQDLIDYILLKPNQPFLVSATRQIKRIQNRWHEKHQDLSDHYALEAELHFSSPWFVSSK
jgi:endonuclease/exonuclease/phosphatase family metal-dependent hydrolase